MLLLAYATLKSHAADTPEFDRLKESYKAAMEKATKPINQTYLTELTKIRDAYTRAANLEAANKVDAEIKLVSSDFGISAAGTAPPQTVVQAQGEEITAVVPANDVNGYKIGPLKKGSVITLSYMSGRWKDHGKLPTDSPDADFTEMGEATRMVIAYGRYKTKPGPTLTKVPAGTAKTPFSYTLSEDVDNVVLRINKDDNDYETNPGSVTYKLKVSAAK